MDHELGSLLARWHQWRHRWTPERGFARAQWLAPAGGADEDDEAFEAMLMRTMEDEITALSPELQLAIQHIARAECLGLEVLTVQRLLNPARRNAVVTRAIEVLRRNLAQAGIL